MDGRDFPAIRELGLIGDRRTAALVTQRGDIVWYCPGRFDYPSVLAALLDLDKGGFWGIELSAATFSRRRYLEDSSILETTLATPRENCILPTGCLWEMTSPNSGCTLGNPV